MKHKLILASLLVCIITCTLGMFCVGYALNVGDGDFVRIGNIGVALVQKSFNSEEIVGWRGIVSYGDNGFETENGGSNVVEFPEYLLPGSEFSITTYAYNIGQIDEYTRHTIRNRYYGREGLIRSMVPMWDYNFNPSEYIGNEFPDRLTLFVRRPFLFEECTPDLKIDFQIWPLFELAQGIGLGNQSKTNSGFGVTNLDASLYCTIEIDAVQAFAIVDAARSAWGIEPTIDDDGYILSLNLL